MVFIAIKTISDFYINSFLLWCFFFFLNKVVSSTAICRIYVRNSPKVKRDIKITSTVSKQKQF